MTVQAPDICVYHSHCIDGFGAAWAVWSRFGNVVEYIPGAYGQDPPDVKDKHVVLVDFSYKRPVLEKMIEECASLLVLDHHVSAQVDLTFLPFSGPAWDTLRIGDTPVTYKKASTFFDMERSGAVITWEFFHPDKPIPELLLHVQDRDLWRFKLKGTREVCACLFSHPYDFEIWDVMASDCSYEEGKALMCHEGEAIDRKHKKDITELLPLTRRQMNIGGYNVPVANLPPAMASDAAGEMAKGEPFAACYTDFADGRGFSLRSREGGIDVSEIAKLYGGGGHKAAAGFRMPIGWEGDAS